MIHRVNSHNLMIQGTMSGVGKSLIVAGLCRLLKQDGLTPAPFKSQNMALNSFVTADGLEMGRAQVMQAYAAGLEPEIEMNPVLLKPTDDTGSQVIVNGRPLKNMPAREYFAYKKTLIPVIRSAYEKLSAKYSPVIIEGAGSPAEINLKENDIVNMGLAEMLDAPVLLAGDIDRGGVFAQLYGTVMLLPEKERARIRGFIINKFRGDPSLLDSGVRTIEEKTGIPVLGVIPYIPGLKLEDEDSLTERFDRDWSKNALIRIAVIHLPRISNFSDFDPFEQDPDVSLIYTSDPEKLKEADLIIIPGSKNTIADMEFLIDKGLAAALKRLCGMIPVIGICGGFQMLGENVKDPSGMEGGGEVDGLGLLPVNTILQKEKKQTRTEGMINKNIRGIFSGLEGLPFSGYEIHMGSSYLSGHAEEALSDIIISTGADVYGTYIHGIFDNAEISGAILDALAKKKGVTLDLTRQTDQHIIRDKEYDRVADILRENLNLTFCSWL
ncbi:MAG: cobyric acid synthase [Lachnospiraceae bacterium]|nr:cobyric acid synthase [Lachnospiraceae bacterium]